MNIEIDGKELIGSEKLILKPDGKAVFKFEGGARITLVFIYDKNKSNGLRYITTDVDSDGQGMTILCYNFNMHGPAEEGLIGEPSYIFENHYKKYYINFKSCLFNATTRILDVNFTRDL